jgi:hypothetical protein
MAGKGRSKNHFFDSMSGGSAGKSRSKTHFFDSPSGVSAGKSRSKTHFFDSLSKSECGKKPIEGRRQNPFFRLTVKSKRGKKPIDGRRQNPFFRLTIRSECGRKAGGRYGKTLFRFGKQYISRLIRRNSRGSCWGVATDRGWYDTSPRGHPARRSKVRFRNWFDHRPFYT